MKFLASPVHEIIAIGLLGFVLGVTNPQCWGRGGCRGSGMVPFERALVNSYRLSIVTFPLPIYALQRYCFASVLQHDTFSPPHL